MRTRTIEPQVTTEDHGIRHAGAGKEADGEPSVRPEASREARKRDASGRGYVDFGGFLHAATPFVPKACTFRAYFPENARICVHGGRKKGRFCGVNRRPFLLSQLPSLWAPGSFGGA